MIDGELLPDGKVLPLEGEHIKPDMTAEVTISVDAVKEPVITAPIQAVIGGAEMGATREVYVKTASRLRPTRASRSASTTTRWSKFARG